EYVGMILKVGDSLGKVTSYNGATKVATIDVWDPVEPVSTNYEILPEVVITGNGSGAKAYARVDDTLKNITGIIITDPGMEYTQIHVTIQTGSGGGSGAELEAVLEPKGGLGSNLPVQMGASYVMLNIKLAFQEGSGDFPIANDYRQIGLIRDVVDSGNILGAQPTYRVSSKLEINNIVEGLTPFQSDELVTCVGVETSIIRVVGFHYDELSTTAGVLYYTQDADTGYIPVVSAMSISGGTSGSTASVVSADGPEVKKFEGEMLYIENRRPILRSPDQIEDIKIIIEW
ncbi:hypothetical protein RZS08_06895, partial [Arthrospira platensis SPKY1]|nr:hypothetical protein [Arthrospira platensis SPKY1]